MITLKGITEEKDWSLEVVKTTVPFTQSFSYAEIQKKMAKKVARFKILSDGEFIGFVELVAYPLFANRIYWYASYGPVINSLNDEIISGLKSELLKFASTTNAVFVRLDFTPTLSEGDIVIAKKYFKLASKSSTIGAYFQPRVEWYTDITKDSEVILAAMHQKTRYSVRYAEKKGVKTQIIKDNFIEHLPEFLRLMKTTSDRNSFSLHSDEYYKSYFEEIEKSKSGFMVIASLDGEVLAMHFIIVESSVAHYVFGASSNSKRELCAPYLAHFNAMLEAKSRGALSYNFGAISLDGENDHWKSLTLFKQKFGGKAFVHSKLFDVVNSSFWYYCYIARKFIKKFI